MLAQKRFTGRDSHSFLPAFFFFWRVDELVSPILVRSFKIQVR